MKSSRRLSKHKQVGRPLKSIAVDSGIVVKRSDDDNNIAGCYQNELEQSAKLHSGKTTCVGVGSAHGLLGISSSTLALPQPWQLEAPLSKCAQSCWDSQIRSPSVAHLSPLMFNFYNLRKIGRSVGKSEASCMKRRRHLWAQQTAALR